MREGLIKIISLIQDHGIRTTYEENSICQSSPQNEELADHLIASGVIKESGIPQELNDTIRMMNSADYKERFKAEYYQTKIRYQKLHKMCVKYEAGTLDFTPTCSLEILTEQKKHMGNYLHSLELRAEIEGIAL